MTIADRIDRTLNKMEANGEKPRKITLLKKDFFELKRGIKPRPKPGEPMFHNGVPVAMTAGKTRKSSIVWSTFGVASVIRR